MRGAYFQFVKAKGAGLESRLCQATEQAQAVRREEAELRLARIQNGKEPSHRNGRKG